MERALRTANCEADALAKGKTDGFDSLWRIHLRLELPRGDILPTALEMGRKMEADAVKAERARKQRRRKQWDRTRAKDPW